MRSSASSWTLHGVINIFYQTFSQSIYCDVGKFVFQKRWLWWQLALESSFLDSSLESYWSWNAKVAFGAPDRLFFKQLYFYFSPHDKPTRFTFNTFNEIRRNVHAGQQHFSEAALYVSLAIDKTALTGCVVIWTVLELLHNTWEWSGSPVPNLFDWGNGKLGFRWMTFRKGNARWRSAGSDPLLHPSFRALEMDELHSEHVFVIQRWWPIYEY